MSATLTFTSVFSHDLDRAARFYAEGFGLREIEYLRSPIFRAFAGGPTAQHATLGIHAPDAYELLGLTEVECACTRSIVTFDPGSVEAVDAGIDAIVALGATLVKGPFDTYYNARQAVFLDPDGNVVRLSHQRP